MNNGTPKERISEFLKEQLKIMSIEKKALFSKKGCEDQSKHSCLCLACAGPFLTGAMRGLYLDEMYVGYMGAWDECCPSWLELSLSA